MTIEAHIPTPEPPGTPGENPPRPGEIPPTPPGTTRPIDDPKPPIPSEPVSEPGPDETPNPKRY